MKLTQEQIEFYNENGYLKIENYLSDEELNLLESEFPKTIDKKSPRIILEDNGEVRSVFAPHFVNKCYENLALLERLVVPTEQLLDSEIYVHQYKINTKKLLKVIGGNGTRIFHTGILMMALKILGWFLF